MKNYLKQKQLKISTLLASLAPLTLIISGSSYALHSHNNSSAQQPLNPKVLKQSLKAYQWALSTGKVHNKKVLTIVDFTLPSNKKRLWVINPKTKQVLLNIYTAQGRNSGVKYATHFSNTPGSKASSLGVYVTGNVYNGTHGQSERLIGLEKGINDNVLSRDIVIHPSHYVTPSYIKKTGMAGRSWGCFAVNPEQSAQLIHLTKGSSTLFAYAPAEDHDVNIV